MNLKSGIFDMNSGIRDVKSRIEKETKRVTDRIKRGDAKSGAAIALALIAIASVQSDDSKAKRMLDLMKDIDI